MKNSPLQRISLSLAIGAFPLILFGCSGEQPVQQAGSSVQAAGTQPNADVQENESPKNSMEFQSQAEWSGDHILTFEELYADPENKVLSDKTKALAGKPIEIKGYMAPPLSAEINFFVLTKYLMEQCPFCSAVAEWPNDIIVVYMPDGSPIEATDHPLNVKGRLDIGPYKDEQTGFVSLVRIYADQVEVME